MFWIFLIFFVLLRLGELLVSRRNEKWLLKEGAIEYGRKHYPFMIALHTFFCISLLVEYLIKSDKQFNSVLLIVFLLLTLLKLYVLSSLGRYWNTKIYRIPESVFIRKRLYKYFKHPNYMIVILEIAIIPLMFNLYFTFIIFSILNGLMLYVRIKEENRVWQD